MSMEEPQRAAAPPHADDDSPMDDSQSTRAPAAAPERRRPRLNLDAMGLGGGERKRGKSMFGVLLNTLNKAKAEDKERSASEAAKKRLLIEQRLQDKLKRDADHVREIEEAKKDKVTATRKEEELQLKDSIAKLRRTRLPLLSNFLLTSDVIPAAADADMDSDFKLSSLLPTRSHPPPLYYLPAVLTPEQDAFLSKRKALAKEGAEKEWEEFKQERAGGIEEIAALRRKVATVQNGREETSGKADSASTGEKPSASGDANASEEASEKDAEMEVDDVAKKNGSRETMDGEKEKERRDAPPAGDEDDAVEY